MAKPDDISKPASERAGRRNTDPEIRTADPVAATVKPAANLPVPVIKAPAGASGPFDAQLIGQPEQKRGLKGGPPVLDHARSAYMGAEYSGKGDRRPPKGVLTRRDI